LIDKGGELEKRLNLRRTRSTRSCWRREHWTCYYSRCAVLRNEGTVEIG
jgi:hypothetical protein